MQLFGRGNALPESIKPALCNHAVILVHGFNGSEDKVIPNYMAVADGIGIVDFRFFGYLWESKGKISLGAYFADRNTAKNRAHQELTQGIEQLHDAGFEKVSIVAHSLGTVVACNAALNLSSASPVDIIMHGGDELRRRFRNGKKFGFVGKNLVNFYSKYDRTLNIAHLLIWWLRVGERALPYGYFGRHSIDASKVAGKKIRHPAYKDDAKVLARTAEVLRGEL